MSRALLLSLLISAPMVGGCGGGAAQCVRSSACGQAAVCQPDGSCGPLAVDAVTRGAHATWLAPTRIALRGTTDDGDAMTLGPSSTVLLAFAGLPLDDAPIAAELVLSPVASRADVPGPARLTVDVVRPFSVSRDPDVVTPSVATRDVAAGPARLVRVDLGDLARAAQASHVRSIEVALRVSGGPLRVASPGAADARMRPRLEILVP